VRVRWIVGFALVRAFGGPCFVVPVVRFYDFCSKIAAFGCMFAEALDLGSVTFCLGLVGV
jgi:hypothetical protein